MPLIARARRRGRPLPAVDTETVRSPSTIRSTALVSRRNRYSVMTQVDAAGKARADDHRSGDRGELSVSRRDDRAAEPGVDQVGEAGHDPCREHEHSDDADHRPQARRDRWPVDPPEVPVPAAAVVMAITGRSFEATGRSTAAQERGPALLQFRRSSSPAGSTRDQEVSDRPSWFGAPEIVMAPAAPGAVAPSVRWLTDAGYRHRRVAVGRRGQGQDDRLPGRADGDGRSLPGR